MNLPGGPNSADQPVSEDYDGNGKADPTVYRGSNSTFYLIHTTNGTQQNIQFGTPNSSIASAGPLMYRISALKGQYATTDGFPSANVNTSYVPVGANSGGLGAASFKSALAASPLTVSAATTTTSTNQVATAPTSPTPTVYLTSSSPKSSIQVGLKTPKVTVATSHPVKAKESVVHLRSKPSAKLKTTPAVAKSHEAKLEVHTANPKVKSTKAEDHLVIAEAIHDLGSIKKGQRHV